LRILRVILAAVTAAFLVLSPGWLTKNLSRNVYAEWEVKTAPSWQGRIVLWHIADFRTYQGKVTQHLENRAYAYCKRHYNVHIDVTGITPEQYAQRIARGEFPDAYSFATGELYLEQLRAFSPDISGLLKNVPPAEANGKIYGVPYLMSGYFLGANTQLLAANNLELGKTVDPAMLQRALSDNLGLSMPAVLAAREKLTGTLGEESEFEAGKALFSVLDARQLGDLQRQTSGNLALEAIPYTAYTDQVFYIGPAKNADDGQAAALADFVSWLLSPGEQGRMTGLGALPVIQAPEDVSFSEPLMEELAKSSSALTVPDPFAYQRHKDALNEEALAALSGETGVQDAFFQRMQVVEQGIF
jgi:ABC-type glycerol-3-phosphate transport system substrate-binding protein